MIDLNFKINILNELGNYISKILKNSPPLILDNLIDSSLNNNRWFDEKSVIYSLKAWSKILKKDLIKRWIYKYEINSFKPFWLIYGYKMRIKSIECTGSEHMYVS